MTEQTFGVETTGGADLALVRVRGDIDLSTATRLGEELQRAVSGTAVVVVDLAGVGFLDSTGVRALVDAHRAAGRLDRHLYVAGAHTWVAKVLDVTGVGPLLAAPPERARAAGLSPLAEEGPA